MVDEFVVDVGLLVLSREVIKSESESESEVRTRDTRDRFVKFEGTG